MTACGRTAVTLLAAVTLALAGCGAEEDVAADRAGATAGPATSTPSTPSTAPTPGAEGEDTDGGPGAGPSGPATGAASGGALTEPQLQSALLTPDDLPTGYTTAPVSTAAADAAAQTCPGRLSVLARPESTGRAAHTAAWFTGAEIGTILQQSLSSYTSEEAAAEHLDAVAAFVADCDRFSGVDQSGTTTEYTVEELPSPQLGDASIALRVVVDAPQFDGEVNTMAVRLGPNVMVLSQGGVAADPAVLSGAATTGLERLAAVSD